MFTMLLLLLAAWAVVFVINIVPVFMPSSWTVMAAFKILGGLPLLPLTIGGAAMSALGRVVLALLSRRFGRRLPETDRKNAEALGAFIERHPRWRILIVFGYCLGPFPSNPLFIAAGVSRLRLLPVAVTFFISRAIADTFWVWTAGKVAGGVQGTFRDQVTSWQAIALQLGSLALLVLVFRLPWAKWLGLSEEEAGESQGQAGSGERQPAGAAR